MTAETWKHTARPVDDAEFAEHLYEHVFRVSQQFDKPFTLFATRPAAGAARTAARVVILNANCFEIGMIGLAEWPKPRTEERAGPPVFMGLGAPFFFVDASDAGWSRERANELGAHSHAASRKRTVVGAPSQAKHRVGVPEHKRDRDFDQINTIMWVEKAA